MAATGPSTISERRPFVTGHEERRGIPRRSSCSRGVLSGSRRRRAAGRNNGQGGHRARTIPDAHTGRQAGRFPEPVSVLICAGSGQHASARKVPEARNRSQIDPRITSGNREGFPGFVQATASGEEEAPHRGGPGTPLEVLPVGSVANVVSQLWMLAPAEAIGIGSRGVRHRRLMHGYDLEMRGGHGVHVYPGTPRIEPIGTQHPAHQVRGTRDDSVGTCFHIPIRKVCHQHRPISKGPDPTCHGSEVVPAAHGGTDYERTHEPHAEAPQHPYMPGAKPQCPVTLWHILTFPDATMITVRTQGMLRGKFVAATTLPPGLGGTPHGLRQRQWEGRVPRPGMFSQSELPQS